MKQIRPGSLRQGLHRDPWVHRPNSTARAGAIRRATRPSGIATNRSTRAGPVGARREPGERGTSAPDGKTHLGTTLGGDRGGGHGTGCTSGADGEAVHDLAPPVPFSGLLDGSVMLLTVRGRRTGTEYALPVQDAEESGTIWVFPGHHERDVVAEPGARVSGQSPASGPRVRRPGPGLREAGA